MSTQIENIVKTFVDIQNKNVYSKDVKSLV